VKRREFISLFGHAVAGWPLVSAAQALGPRGRIGVLAQDLQPGLLETFRDELRNLGYVENSNINIEVRTVAALAARTAGLFATITDTRRRIKSATKPGN
jgi:hypothetical protein